MPASSHLSKLLFLALLLTSALPAQAQIEQKLTASDGTENDRFGYSVAFSNDAAIFGAPFDGDNGTDSGSAYIFRWDGEQWVEEQKLTASDGTMDDAFGTSVAISGDRVLIGAYGDSDNGTDSGSAYIFRWDGEQWVEEQKLTASDGAEIDRFGTSVSIADDTAIVGAFLDDDNGMNSGSVYVFRWNGTEWVEEQKLTASDGEESGLFGYAVSATDDVVLVGADGSFESIGRAYVFRWNGTEWVEEQKLIASDGQIDDLFGFSVSTAGDIAVVGSAFDNVNGTTGRGSAYVFKWNGTEWVEEQKLTASENEGDARFGYSVSVEDGLVLIGSPYGGDNRSGSAYVFRQNETEWVEELRLTASDENAGDNFGWSVAVSADVALVAAIGAEDDSGSAYAYSLKPFVAAEPNVESPVLALRLAGPNPFRTSTALALSLDHPQAVRIEAFDVVGRRVALLHDGALAAGEHRVAVSSAGLAPGLYVIRASGEVAVQSLALVLTR